jgi:VWFA-related protein
MKFLINKIWRILFFLCFSLISLNLASTQKQENSQELRHEVAVTLKLVQVYVTDKKGNPARNLEISDFILYDNGKLQEITDFEKHFLDLPEPKLEEPRLTPERDMTSFMNRKFFFLIDIENNDLEGIAKSKNAALEFIDKKAQPSDAIALLSYSTVRGLNLHEYLTSDHQKVRDAIEKVRVIPGVKGGWDSWAELGHSVMGMEAEKLSAPISPAERRIASLRFSSSLQDLAKALRHIPGQKNIMLFSKGYGKSVLMYGSSQGDAFRAMAKELASANSPVFSINTTTGMAKRKVLPDGALDYLSKLTGGNSFHDVNYYSDIAEDIQNATGNYYVLGYSIESTWDGKFHDIKVEVKKAGYKVHAQRGYFNPIPFNQFSPVEKHFHLLALALGENAYSEQHMNFPLIALPFSEKKESNTVLISEIPVRRIRAAVGNNTEFIGLILDRNKNIVDIKRMKIDWRAHDEEKVYQYSTAALEPGRYDCRAVIRNLDNGKGAVGACSVEMPVTAGENLKLLPPLLFISGIETQYLHVIDPDKDASSKSFSLFKFFPFQSKEYIPLIGEFQHGTPSLYAALRCIWKGIQEPKIRISVWLESPENSKRIPLAFQILSRSRQEETDVLFLEMKIPELQPGRYLLHLMAEDEVTESSSQTTSSFSVKPVPLSRR